jgi:2-amino-4-hydroxy-6-hydroxymethyldihydropteridine diphosphokinase
MLEPLARVEAVSPLYESEPQPPSSQPSYINGATRIVTGLAPAALLRHVKQIEYLIGRRAGERWGPRPIDIDLLLYDDLILETPALVLPHPRIRERTFVLRPLLDLDPNLVHPGTGERLANLLAALSEADLPLAPEQA